MSVTPKLSITELVEGQAVPETDLNQTIRIVEQGAVDFLVLDRSTAPPGSPTDGFGHLIIATATGAWAGKEDQLAFRIGSAWHYVTPEEGMTAYVWGENKFYMYDGNGSPTWFTWNADDAAIWAGNSSRRFLCPTNLYTAAAPVALTSSASVTPDFSAGLNYSITLAHSGQLENPSNMKAGQSGVIEITQDGTGNRAWSYGTNWTFPGGAPVLSTAAGAVDILAYWVKSASVIRAVMTKAYSA